MLQRNRPLLKRQGFASTARPRCRFFAAIAPASQRGMTHKIQQIPEFIDNYFFGTCIVCPKVNKERTT
jgi:hypothetical protein